MKIFSRMMIVVLLLAMLIAPVAAQDEDMPTIAEAVVAAASADEAQFTVLLAALQAADPVFLEVASDPEASVTVFAPTDAAFIAALEALGLTAEELLGDTETLNRVLSYHIVGTALMAEDVVAFDGAYIGTLAENAAVMISVSDEGVFVDDAQVVLADLAAANGVIHVIDSVILPPAAEEAMADDMVEEEPMSSIAEVVVAAASADEPQFTVLLAAVQAADPSILALLSGEAGYGLTVFAPTDAAFAAAFEALGLTAADVLASTDLLNAVLAYHVLPGIIESQGFVYYAEHTAMMDEPAMPSFATLLGGATLEFNGTDLTVNGLGISAVDIKASNGVIHVIDGVLLPPSE